MPAYQTLSASISGPVEFSDEEWARIEAAGKRPIGTELRMQIHDSCLTYLLLYHAENNRILEAQLRKSIKAVLRHSHALHRLLLPQRDSRPHNVALELIGQHLRQPQTSTTQPFPAWDSIWNIARAADRALKQLPAVTTEVSTGSRHQRSFTYLVDELGELFSAAGGNAKSPGIREPKDAPMQRGSPFSDFIYEIQSCLPEHPPPKSKKAVGERIHEVFERRPGRN